jgi:hypothetical protein
LRGFEIATSRPATVRSSCSVLLGMGMTVRVTKPALDGSARGFELLDRLPRHSTG